MLRRKEGPQSPRRLPDPVALVPLVVGNAMAGTGTLSGEGIGIIANRRQTRPLPADELAAVAARVPAA